MFTLKLSLQKLLNTLPVLEAASVVLISSVVVVVLSQSVKHFGHLSSSPSPVQNVQSTIELFNILNKLLAPSKNLVTTFNRIKAVPWPFASLREVAKYQWWFTIRYSRTRCSIYKRLSINAIIKLSWVILVRNEFLPLAIVSTFAWAI